MHWVRLLIGVALLLAAAPASARTLSTEDFLASSAAGAYREGKYAEALQGLDALQAQYPDNVTVKRVRGMALYNLERYHKAAVAFRGVVALDPGNAAARFWLGATLHKVGNTARAYAAFKHTVDLAPGSAYAAQAKKFIDFIDRQIVAVRRWSLDLASGVQYDDNVSLTNSGRIESARPYQQVDGRHVLLVKPGWSVTAEAGGYFSQNTGNGVDEFANRAADFDLAKAKGGLDIRHDTAAFGIPVAVGFNYAFDLVYEGYDRFSDIHTVTTSLEANPTPRTIAKLYHRFDRDFFADEGFDRAFSSRDGTRHAVGIEKYVYLKDKRHYLWAAYEYMTTDADGVNFDARQHLIASGFSWALPRKVVLAAGATYASARYVNFAGPRKRRSAKQTYSAELSRPMGEKLTMVLGYSYAFDNSNIASLETLRNLATVSIKRKF